MGMIDDIKFDKLGMTKSSGGKPAKADTHVQSDMAPKEGVSVKNHLQELTSLLGSTEFANSDEVRVQAVKNLIQSGQYKVNVDALSEKLLDHGLIVMGH